MTGSAPELKPWYRVAVGPAGVTLRFGASALLFEGSAAHTLLTQLLPLLDGTRDIEELAGSLGPPIRPAIEHALGLLAEHGLLHEPPLDDIPERMRTLELVEATDVAGRTAAQLRATLHDATVGVVGDGALAEEIGRLLHRSGIDAVTRDWNADLVVAAPRPSETAQLERWNETALERGVPWLQLVPFDGSIASVGPLFVPGQTACHRCFRLRRALDGAELDEQPVRAHHLSSPALDATMAGLAASIAIRWLSTGDSAAVGTLLALEPEPRVSLTRHAVYRVPRCPACSPLSTRATLAPWSAEVGVAA